MVAGTFALLMGLSSPPDAVTLEADVQALLSDRCALCHDGEDGLDLSAAPSSLVGMASSTGKPLIAPADPAASYLLAKVTGQDIQGELMPLADDPLSAEELGLLQNWILALEPAAAADAQATDPSVPEPASGAGGQAPGDGAVDTAPALPMPIAPPQKARPNFSGTHQINLQSTTTLGKKTLEFRVHHRFGQVSGERAYLGLASGAVMSLGVGYGIVDGLDAMLRWSNSRLDWELGMKYAPLRQVDGKPLSLALYASFEALGDFPERSANRLGGNFQASASRLFFERWATQLTVNYSMLTNHDPAPTTDFGSGPEPSEDKRGTLDLGLASTVWLGKKRKWGLDLEYILPIPDGGSPNVFYYAGGDTLDGPVYGGVTLGASARAGLHFFQVFISNQQNIHTNQVAPGATGRIEKGELFLGFNLSRKWKL